MKKLPYLLLLLCFYNLQGQVGIGTITPHESANLEVAGGNKGTILSQVALTGSDDAITIPNPAVGLLVFNTTAVDIGSTTALPVGYHYWNGTKWVGINVTSSPVSNANGTIKTYAYVGPYTGQVTGLNVGDFSFRLFLSPNAISGSTSEYVGPQIINNTGATVDLTGFAAMQFGSGGGMINYTTGNIINTSVNIANPNTRTLPASTWAWWGESGFIQIAGGSTSEKRQYTLTTDDADNPKFWRIEFMFINPGGTVATMPTSKCIIYVEEIIGKPTE